MSRWISAAAATAAFGCGLAAAAWAWSASRADEPERLSIVDRPHPKGYVARKAVEPPQIDGKLDDPAWEAAAWTDLFIDIEGDVKPRPRFATRAKMTWDDEYFYVAAEMEEPHVWGTLTEHDAVIFQDNDFEVFVDPDGDTHNYYEFEINALNTGWDLFLAKPYKDGGPADNSWEIPGLRAAVRIEGTLNNPADVDRGWTVEMAFPWSAFNRGGDSGAPPREGDRWRVNFSRVEWRHEIVDGAYRKVPNTPEDNWVWSPQHAINMHLPEYWGHVQFEAADSDAEFKPDPTWPARMKLFQVYELQKRKREADKRYARTAGELGPDFPPGVALEATDEGWTASTRTTDERGRPAIARLRHDAKLTVEPIPNPDRD